MLIATSETKISNIDLEKLPYHSIPARGRGRWEQNDEPKSTAERFVMICNIEQVNSYAACKGCPPIALVCNTAGQQDELGVRCLKEL